MEVGLDDLLPPILDKIRPIQHRVTLVQADAPTKLLEALARDPHFDVRRVVAGHASINEEVCFRLCEDQHHKVRLTLRKNDHCHPVLRASLRMREQPGHESRVLAARLVDLSWQGRRAGFKPDKVETLFEEWLSLEAEDFHTITLAQVEKMTDVMAGHLGTGPMPRKPRKRTNSKSTRTKAAKKSTRTKAAKSTRTKAVKKSTRTKAAKKSTRTKAAKKSTRTKAAKKSTRTKAVKKSTRTRKSS